MRVRSLAQTEDFLSRYDYTAKLTKSRWAWEFLRRNPDFRRAAFRSYERAISVLPLGYDNLTLLKVRPLGGSAKKWGLLYYPNPEVSGLAVDLFWCPQLYQRALRVNIVPGEPGIVDPIYARTVETCEVRHLTDADGYEHLLLNGCGCFTQVTCSGQSFISGEPFKIDIIVDGLDHLSAKLEVMKRSARIYGVSDGAIPDDWNNTTLRFRNMLVALDAKDAGMTLRETSEILFGEERTLEGFGGGQTRMKGQIARLRSSGENMRGGGYKTLLQHKT